MRLDKLLHHIAPLSLRGDTACEVSGVTEDSRQVQDSAMFVAVSGYQTDGRRFIPEAIAKGARVVVMEAPNGSVAEPLPADITEVLVPNARQALANLAAAFYGHPSRDLHLVGITGTNGKTTISYLLDELYTQDGQRCGIIGTIGYRIGDEVIEPSHTTPGAVDLQHYLLRLREHGCTCCIMEASSHALELYRVDGTEFDIAIFTNLTQDHFDFHETIDRYYAAKRRLFVDLAPRLSIINVDDPWGRRLAAETSAPVITYGLKEPADVEAHEVKLSIDGVHFRAVVPNGSFPVSAKLLGSHNVANLLAAIAVGYSRGIRADVIQRIMRQVRPVPGRFEVVSSAEPFLVVVDYAHTDDALRNVLRAARQLTSQHLITVFGCGGDRDRKKRPLMGQAAVNLSELTIITSDNPRSEAPQAIISDILEGVSAVTRKGHEVTVEVDRRKAIEKSIAAAAEGDIVIIAGKGHETYQILRDRTIHFDDREVAREVLAARSAARN